MRALSTWALGLFSGRHGGLGTNKVPKAVRRAEQSLVTWLDRLRRQTQEQVRESLGAPAKEGTWIREEKEEPLLKYEVGESTTLSLYFFKGRVIKTSLQVLR
jgi:hypothetical protein